ncbi:recombinase family protein [Clostridium sp. B9]|uniref:recombinase family protein n=1 Tax=Clostridium sp. B9 TaxID=3423224 RepID=UPI003D2F2C5E
MKRVAIYSRKSVESFKGDSISVQNKLVKNYFSGQECEFELFEDEGFSGGNNNRPAYKLMMEKVKRKEIDIVAIYKLDRIARNIIDFFKTYEEFKKYNVTLISVTENFDPRTPAGMMMMTMLAGMAEMERMNIKQRVKDNMLELAKSGKWTGGTLLLGYESYRTTENGKECSYLKENKSESSIVKDIFNIYLECFSANKVKNEINKRYNLNTSTRRILNILSSPCYVNSSKKMDIYLSTLGYDVIVNGKSKAYLTYGKNTTSPNGGAILNKDAKTLVAPSNHVGIISEDIWIKTQEKLKQNSLDPKPRISKFTWLAHMVKCGYCKKNMVVETSYKLGKPNIYFRKKCKCNHTPYGSNGKKQIKNSRLTIPNAETYVFNYLKDINSKGIHSFISKQNTDDKYTKQIKSVNKELLKVDKLIDGLTDKLSLANDDILEILLNKLTDYSNRKKKLQEDLLILKQKQVTLESKENNINILSDTLEKFLNNFSELSIEEKQIEIRKIIKDIEWKGDKKEFVVNLLDV